MEPRKYSTGTKGRIKMHNDRCKEFIHANSPSFSLANEFIESIDPDHEERVWQRFQNPAEILPELKAWLGEEVVQPAETSPIPDSIPRRPGIKPASHLLPETAKIDAALNKTREWLAGMDARAEFTTLPPAEAAETALRRLYREFTGRDPK